MNVGELFVNLGIRGSEKTLGALGSVHKGLKESGNTAIETKAAIVGVLYGIEQLISSSLRLGSSLTNFGALTGLSPKVLQQWQYAAQQAGVANEEVTASFRGVQKAMNDTLFNQKPPKWLSLVAQQTHLDTSKLNDTVYVLQKLQEFATKSPINDALKNEVLQSFGVSDGVIAAMKRNEFRPEVMAKAPVISEAQIRALDRANAAWANMEQKVKMAFAAFSARHAGELVKDVSLITTSVIKLADSFVKLSEKIKLFEGIGKVFQGWGLIFDGIATAVDKIRGDKNTNVAQGVANEYKSNFQDEIDLYKGIIQSLLETDTAKKLNPQGFGKKIGDLLMPPTPATVHSTNQQFNINQTLQFQHDGRDAKKVSQTHKQGAQHAYRQNPALKGGI